MTKSQIDKLARVLGMYRDKIDAALKPTEGGYLGRGRLVPPEHPRHSKGTVLSKQRNATHEYLPKSA